MATSYSNPGGSGDRTTLINVTASSNTLSTTPNRLIDGKSQMDIYFYGYAVAGQYIQFDFFNPKIISEITLSEGDTTTHGNWHWQGSNDATNWTTLKSNFVLGSTPIVPDSVGLYRYYRLLGVSGNSSNAPWIYEINFKIGDNLVGQQLTSPEAGWRRYDDTDSRIKCTGVWVKSTNDNNWYSLTKSLSTDINATVTVKFYGSKFRLIGPYWDSMPTKMDITIDGVKETINVNNSGGTNVVSALLYEKILTNGTHTIVLSGNSANTNTQYVIFDAIDLDSTGYLVHPTLNQVSNLLGMAVGDCIPCRYTATTSGSAGYFSELGTCTATEIPIAGTATPDGLFYFVKTAKGTLVADRIIQTNISWDTLNAAKFIEGVISNLVPPMTSNVLPTGIASANQSYGSSYDAYKLFDNLDTTDYASPVTATLPVLLEYEFSSTTIINQYKIKASSGSGNYCPKTWTFEGSNDGVAWTTIDTRTNITGWSAGELKTFDFTNNMTYKKYRLNISSGNSSQIQFSQLSMYNSHILVRSLSGGCAYADANGNKSLTDCGKGAYPTNNEWDKYIVNSDLGGKITPGDDNVWHKDLLCFCKGTGLTATYISSTGTTLSFNNIHRIIRGNNNIWHDFGLTVSSSVGPTNGFRPVLEFIESDSKQTILWC